MSKGPVDRWNARYEQEDTPWDLGAPTPAWQALLKGRNAPAPCQVVFPGCGRGHDALLFAEHGFEVLGFDFAPRAIAEARALAAVRESKARFERLDLFALPTELEGRFDLLVEYTCFCAIDPELRADYVASARSLLRPGGRLLGLFFPTTPFGSEGEPPHVVTKADVERHFSEAFTIDSLEPASSSEPTRAGFELLGWLTKR